MYANILSTKRRQSYNFFPKYANILCILFKALSKMVSITTIPNYL